MTPLVSDGRPLPFASRWLVEEGLTEFRPWCFIEEQAESDIFRAEFAKEVAAPNPSVIKDFQPFARHGACDDFAGFIIRDGRITKEVLYVHLTFLGRSERAGFPGMTRYDDVWAWLTECVIDEMRLVADRLEEHHRRRPQQ
jgi:hypothetical protein